MVSHGPGSKDFAIASTRFPQGTHFSQLICQAQVLSPCKSQITTNIWFKEACNLWHPNFMEFHWSQISIFVGLRTPDQHFLAAFTPIADLQLRSQVLLQGFLGSVQNLCRWPLLIFILHRIHKVNKPYLNEITVYHGPWYTMVYHPTQHFFNTNQYGHMIIKLSESTNPLRQGT